MGTCEDCGKRNLFRKTGKWITIDGKQRRQMQCRCGHIQLELPPVEAKIPPKVLYFDIETSTSRMVLDVFSMRVKTGWLDWHDIEKPFYVICWSAAWVTDKAPVILSDAVTGYEAKRRKDKRCLQGLWDLMDSADYVVGHNSIGFDVKMVNTRFLLNGMGTPQDFRQVDTYRIARTRFRPESQALAYWSKLLGGNPKDKMCREDWDECNLGNEKAIKKMLHYNKGDVREGVNVLKKMLAHIEGNGRQTVFK